MRNYNSNLCYELVSNWLDLFRKTFAGTLKGILPRPIYYTNPITSWVGPVESEWSSSHEHMLFTIHQHLIPNKKGGVKFQSKRLKEVIARNYNPTWIQEAILGSVYKSSGQEHLLRPLIHNTNGREVKEPLSTYITLGTECIDENTLEDITFYIYALYESIRDAENTNYRLSLEPDYSGPPRCPRVYGHWSL